MTKYWIGSTEFDADKTAQTFRAMVNSSRASERRQAQMHRQLHEQRQQHPETYANGCEEYGPTARALSRFIIEVIDTAKQTGPATDYHARFEELVAEESGRE